MSVRVSEMAKSTILALCAASWASLPGCASNPRCPKLPGGPRYCLQSTTAIVPHVALQDIRIRGGDLDERLIVQLEVDASGMHLAGLTPVGQRVADASFDNRIASASSLAGGTFDAGALLSLVQLAVWPADSVSAGLDEGWRIEESPHLRKILHDGETTMEVVREGTPPKYERLEIRLPSAGLSLIVDAIDDHE